MCRARPASTGRKSSPRRKVAPADDLPHRSAASNAFPALVIRMAATRCGACAARSGDARRGAARHALGNEFSESSMEAAQDSGNPLQAWSEHIASLVEDLGKHVVAVHVGRHETVTGVAWRSGVIVTVAHALP